MTPAPTDPADIRSFLALHHPFDLLPADVLAAVAAEVNTIRVAPGHVLMKPGDAVDCLYVVRSGALETRGPDGELLARLGEGECGGVRALLRGGKAVNQNAAIEESVLIRLPAALFENLRRDHRSFAYFFAAFDGGRLQDSIDETMGRRSMDLMSKTVGQLLSRGPVTVPKGATILDAARVMRERNVSCVMVTDDNALVGIFTDRDLRNRVVADERPFSAPVAEVMSPNPRRVEVGDHAFEALLLMSRHGIHHLPVVDRGAIVGCLTSSTIVESHTSSPIYLTRSIRACDSAAALAGVVRRIPALVQNLVDSGATAQSIGRITTTMTDAVTVRLLELAEAALGPAPVPYVWLALGSQGRQEQSALSDQDNCLILADSYDAAAHGEYFTALSRFVCEGLDTCGYVFCPGEMMAQTGQWRQPLAVWKEYFRKWIEEPDPKALMLSSVFFDLRPVHGDTALYEDLHGSVLEKTKKNRIFLAYMAKNALSRQPPVGFFRNFVLIHGGEHDHTLDLKLSGVVPIVDLARVYALSAGLGQVNTWDRLAAAGAAKALSRDGMTDLTDALEFIAMTRLRHQARMIREGRKADNFLPPDELSSFERSHLKAAFTSVKTMQASLAATYQLGRF